ncbi:MAG: hypothetical protein PHD11_09445 [Bacteroidales bacterium]|nr:hypothetical protein [Bacteroidales bacterium]MDD4671277.1 hypothetical protein [Bacteroidales bacterium]
MPIVQSSRTQIIIETADHKKPAEQSEQAYMDFLNGKIKVTTCEQFRADDNNGNFDGILYGSYSFSELKDAVAENEMSESNPKYAMVDFGHDGTTELVLRFESKNISFNSWVGIIKFDGTNLNLNYYYEDGYRTFSNLYTSGYLVTGGAVSASESITSLFQIDENGFGKEVTPLVAPETYQSDEVTWLDVNRNPSFSENKGSGDEVSVAYAAEDLLSDQEAYYKFTADESEYRVNVLLSTSGTLTNFRVLSLIMEDVSTSGEAIYSYTEIYALPKLTSEKPLVLTMTFAGDIPNMGIAYVDNSGQEQVRSIAMSGEDGSLLLNKAILKQ